MNRTIWNGCINFGGIVVGAAIWFGVATGALAQCNGVPECQPQAQTPFAMTWPSATHRTFACRSPYPFAWGYSYSQKGGPHLVAGAEDYHTWTTLKVEFVAPCVSSLCGFIPVTAIQVTLACSKKIDPDASGPTTCDAPYGPDPKQPEVRDSYANSCGGGPIDACVATWRERDPITKQLYNCMNIEGVSTCQKCAG
jgi:hypothetical protein